jgi:hypothetical protein
MEKINNDGFTCCVVNPNFTANALGISGFNLPFNVNEVVNMGSSLLPAVVISPGSLSSSYKLSSKLTRQFAAKFGPSIKILARRIVGNRINKLVRGIVKPKYLVKILAVAGKVGAKLSTAASKQAAKIATKLATANAKLAAKYSSIAAAAAASTSTVFGAPVGGLIAVGGAILSIFDGLSLLLDLGDPGGYGELEYKATYRKLKEQLDAEFKQDLKDNGYPAPYEQITGPLDYIEEEDLVTTMAEISNEIFENKYLQETIKKVEARASNDMSEQEIGVIFDEEASKIQTIISNLSYEDMCKKFDGFMVGDKCSFKKQECNDYEWPIDIDNGAEIDGGSFRRFKDGKCLAEGPEIRSACEESGIPYDFETGICDITEEYCKLKGADWLNDDCKVQDGQKFFEYLVGETVVRGLKQIFDPKQFEPCVANEKDDGYFCRKQICKLGEEVDGDLCYPKPLPGFVNGGGPLAWAECPPGFTYNGVFCGKPPAVERGIGEIPKYSLCLPGSFEHGTGGECKSCYGGKRNANLAGSGKECDMDCPIGYDKDPNGQCFTCGGDGWLRTANPVGHKDACFKVTLDGSKELVTYKPATFAADWVNSWKSTGKRTRFCPKGKYFEDGLCYSRCPPGTRPFANKCYADCPPNTTDAGLTCTRHNYGRGAGNVPETTIRAKKRVIPFGTTNKFGLIALIPKNK